MLEELIEKKVTIHLGTLGGITDSVKGEVVAIEDSWIMIKTKKETEFINLNTIRRITLS